MIYFKIALVLRSDEEWPTSRSVLVWSPPPPLIDHFIYKNDPGVAERGPA
jgi:hypothetical protein